MILRNKIAKSQILQVLMLFINPFISLLLSILFLFNKQKISMLSLSVSISIIIIYLPLAPDVAANFFQYLRFDDSSLLLFSKGLYLAIPKFLNEYLDQQYTTTLFLYLVFILYVWFKSFEFHMNKVQNLLGYYYMLIFVLFSLIELRMTGLNKNILSITVIYLFLFLHNIKNKNHIFIYLLVPISIIIHPISLSFVLLYLFAKVLKSQIFYLLTIVISIFGMFLILPILEYILELLSVNGNIVWIEALDYYIHSSAHGFVPMVGFDLQIRIIELPFLLITYYMGLQLLKNNNTVLIRFILLTISVTIIFLFMHSFYERYSIASYIFSSFIIYEYVYKEGKKLKQILLFLISVLIVLRFFHLNINIYGYIYDSQKYSKVLPSHDKKIDMMLKSAYQPLLYLLNVKEYGYSDKYIQDVTTYSGEMKK